MEIDLLAVWEHMSSHGLARVVVYKKDSHGFLPLSWLSSPSSLSI